MQRKMCKQGTLPPTASPIINKKAIQTFRVLGRIAFRKKLIQHAIFYSGDKSWALADQLLPSMAFHISVAF